MTSLLKQITKTAFLSCLLLLAHSVLAQSAYRYLQYKTNDMSLSPTNILGSNVLAGANISVAIATDGSGRITIASSGGTASAGGADKEVQFNDGGAVSGASAISYDKTTKVLRITNAVYVGGEMAMTNLAANCFVGLDANKIVVGKGVTNVYIGLGSGMTIATNHVGEEIVYTLTANLVDPTNHIEAKMVEMTNYVNSLMGGGTHFWFYGSSNAFGATIPVGTCLLTNWALADVSPQVAATNTVNVTSSGQYAAAYVSTQLFTTIISGSAQFEVWCYENSTPGSLSLAAEFYAVDTVTGVETEFGSAPAQAVAAGTTPTKLTFTVPMSDFGPTNNLRAAFKLKTASVVNTPTLALVTEGVYSSHAVMGIPSTSTGSGTTEYIAAGTGGISVATNGSLYTISTTAGGGSTEYIKAGGGITVGTNSTEYTVSANGDATNHANALSVNATNQSLLIGANTTNHVNQKAVDGTNYTLSVGANTTNDVLRVGANGTNHSDALSVNGTNYTLLVGGNVTNHANQKALDGTNDVLRVGANTTNDVLRVGANGTNESLRLAGLNTNHSLWIGGNATSEVARVAALSTNNTDGVSNALRWSTQLGSNNGTNWAGLATNSVLDRITETTNNAALPRTNVNQTIYADWTFKGPILADIPDEETNALAGVTIPMGKVSLTNCAGNITFTGLTGVDNAKNRKALVHLLSGGAERTITIPTSWQNHDVATVFYVSNGWTVLMSIETYGSVYTNVSWIHVQ